MDDRSGAGKESISEIAAVEITRYLERLPLDLRRQLGQPSTYVSEVERAYAKAGAEHQDPRLFIKDFMDRAVLSDPRLLGRAIEIADQELAHYDRIFRPVYGDAIVDVEAAKSFAAISLYKLWRQLEKGADIADAHRYLRSIVRGEVVKMVDEAMRSVDPGRRARHRLFKSLLSELGQRDPELSDAELRERAAKMADEKAACLGHLLRQTLDEHGIDALEDPSNPFKQIFDDDIVRMIDDIIRSSLLEGRQGKPPHFRGEDLRTWELFKAADFVGGDIDWPGECGISAHTGSQRLFALLCKLAIAIDDWRD